MLVSHKWAEWVGNVKPYWAGLLSTDPHASPLEDWFQHEDFIVIVYMLRGKGEFWLRDGTCIPVNEKDLIFCKPRVVHKLNHVAGGDRVHHYLIASERFWKEFVSVTDSEAFDRSFEAVIHRGALTTEEKLRCEHVFGEVSLGSRQHPKKIELYHFLSEVIPMFTRKAAHMEFPDGTPKWLREACLAMTNPDRFRAGIPAFVDVSGRSLPYLCRMMQKWMKMTPGEYVNSVRVEFAKSALSDLSRDILSAASISGFNNLPHFYKVFKKFVGMTPGEYRNDPNAFYARQRPN